MLDGCLSEASDRARASSASTLYTLACANVISKLGIVLA